MNSRHVRAIAVFCGAFLLLGAPSRAQVQGSCVQEFCRYTNSWVSCGTCLQRAPTTNGQVLGGMSTTMQSAAQSLGMQMGMQLGTALGNWLAGGGPSEQARLQALAAQRQAALAAEISRQEDEAQRRAAQDAQQRQAMYARLGALLKVPSDALMPKGFDGDGGDMMLKGTGASRDNALGLKLDDGPRPSGTPFFGDPALRNPGAPPPEPINDPKVVDLRNFQTASYIVQQSDKAMPNAAELAVDEAVSVATGRKTIALPPDASAPWINEKGLLAFQQANIDYARAHDSNLRITELFVQHQRRLEVTQQIVASARADLEKTIAERADQATLQQKHALMAKVFAALKEEEQAYFRARAEADKAQADENFNRALMRTALRFAAVPDPTNPALVLERERKAVEPTMAQRVAHAANRFFAEPYIIEAEAYFARNFQPANDPALEARLGRLLQRVRALSPYPTEPESIRLLGSPLNPGEPQRGVFSTAKTVFVEQQFLRDHPNLSDNELIVILSHEVAHVQRDHYALAARAETFERERQARDPNAPTARDPAIAEWIREDARKARLQDFEQAQELEADRLGAYMALQAGAPPSAIREVYRIMAIDEATMQRQMSKAAAEQLRITRDHPTATDRYEALRQIYGSMMASF
jgi:Zn-dependent protease with chaperone function